MVEEQQKVAPGRRGNSALDLGPRPTGLERLQIYDLETRDLLLAAIVRQLKVLPAQISHRQPVLAHHGHRYLHFGDGNRSLETVWSLNGLALVTPSGIRNQKKRGQDHAESKSLDFSHHLRLNATIAGPGHPELP